MKPKKQSWFSIQSIGGGIIIAILILTGFSMYSNYTATKKFKYFNSELSYIEDRAWEMPELVESGVYSAEEGLEELQELTERFEEIEDSIYYKDYDFSQTHLIIFRTNLMMAETSLLASKRMIINYKSKLKS